VDSRRLIISVAGIGPTSQNESADSVRSVEVKALIPLDRRTDEVKEVYLDDEGNLRLSQASAGLPWAAGEDGSGSYSGELCVAKVMSGKTRILLRECLKSSP
jgi:hypothetical protein